MSDARLTEIEIALTHAEAGVEELGAVVRAQADRIDRLERRLAALAALVVEAEARAGAVNVHPLTNEATTSIAPAALVSPPSRIATVARED